MSATNSTKSRLEIIAEVEQWTPLEFSIVCILTYKKDVTVDNVYEYLQANPTIIISCTDAETFHQAFLYINNNAAYPTGTARRNDWIKRFAPQAQQMCKTQYNSWVSSNRDQRQFFKEHMQMEKWFPPYDSGKATAEGIKLSISPRLGVVILPATNSHPFERTIG